MATSKAMDTSNQYVKYTITITQNSQNITNNTSNVTVSVRFYRTNTGYETYGSGTVYCKINGVQYSTSVTSSQKITSSGIVLFSKTLNIAHNADGTKTLNTSAWISHSVVTSSEQSYSEALATIPRATTPTLSSSSFDMGSSITISTPRASSSFTHTLTYQFGSLSGTIATGVATSRTWNVPLTLANAIPNATSGTGSITCQTYNGSTLIGTKSVPFVVKVPTSVVPSISSVSIEEAVEGIASKFNGFVQNRSKLNVSINANGVYNSTITKYETYIQAVHYLGSSFTSNLITASGTIGVLTIVTDSRGRTAQITNNVTILEYSSPTIAAFSAYRCDNDGNPDYEGTKLKVTVNFDISTVNNLNDKYYEILYKVKGAASWAGTLVSGNVYSRDDSFITAALFSGDETYELMIRIWDFFVTGDNGVYASLDIPTAFTLIDFRATGKGIAFGKVSESDNMEIALDLDLSGEFIQEDRQTPTLLNSWVNYGSGYESVSYFKDKCNVVHLAGMVKSGTTTAETVIFTLPEGYRPRASEKFFCVSLNAICVIDVYATGNVAIKAGANNGWISLSGISFLAS